MRSTGNHVSTLVVAAQAGDRQALDRLLADHLPFVYTIVRRALGGHSDADDVVQDTMLRALRELRDLRSPTSFRAWLAAIAVRQVSTHLHRRTVAAERTALLEDLDGTPDSGASFEGLTALQLELSNQRRQVAIASHWLDPDDRALLSLWWLEVAGLLTRAELADALGLTIPHAGVRVQRMRGQLELSRALVAALEAQPRCHRLDDAIEGWDATPSPLWRKRVARHTSTCTRCSATAGRGIAAERLLGGFALLPVPIALTAAPIGKLAFSGAAAGAPVAVGATGAAGAKAGIISQIAHALGAHPAVASVVAASVVAAAAWTTVAWPPSPPARPPVIAAPTVVAVVPLPAPPRSTPTRAPSATTPTGPTPAATPALSVGPASLESVSGAGSFVATADTYGVLATVSAASPSDARQAATFEVVAGLADSGCFSFRLRDGQYLRHSDWRLRSYPKATYDTLLAVDATFCPHPGAVAGSILLASFNYPHSYLHRRGNELWVGGDDGTTAFQVDASFRVRPPLYD